MVQIHKRLSSVYKRLITESFTEEKRIEYSKLFEIQPFKHPGDLEDETSVRKHPKAKEEMKGEANASLSISLNSSKSEEDYILNMPKGDDNEDVKRSSLFQANSPQPILNDEAIHTPSMTFEDISVNDEFQDPQHESDKVDGLNDKIIVGSIHILNTKDKKFMNKKITPLSERILDNDPISIGNFIMNDLGKISEQLIAIWHKIIKSVQIEPRFILENLKMDYEAKI